MPFLLVATAAICSAHGHPAECPFWSVGLFSSTVGIDEAVIKRYVEFQEKVDRGELKLQLDFGF